MTTKNSKLHELMQNLKKKETKNIEEIYEIYSPLVKKIAFSILKNRDDSEDVMQEVFVKICNISKEKLPENGEMNWLYLVTKNTTIDFIKKKKLTIDIDEIYNLKNDNDEIEEFIDKESYSRLIANLSEKEIEIISLKIFSGFSFKEIGSLMNLPTSTISWKYYTSINKLKVHIEQLLLTIVFFGIYILNYSYNPKGSSNIYVRRTIGIIALFWGTVFFILFIINIIKSRKKIYNESSIK